VRYLAYWVHRHLTQRHHGRDHAAHRLTRVHAAPAATAGHVLLGHTDGSARVHVFHRDGVRGGRGWTPGVLEHRHRDGADTGERPHAADRVALDLLARGGERQRRGARHRPERDPSDGVPGG